MKIRIVCYENPDLWILGKFAKKLNENLLELGVDSDISNITDHSADINHHIIFSNFNGKASRNDTLMITHVDNIDKLNKLRKSLDNVSLGICMSSDTMFALSEAGLVRDKICFIKPAHDQKVEIKKIVIGIFCRVQPDGRKREYFLNKLVDSINKDIFKFIIMGDSWDPQVQYLKKMGFEIEYYNTFNLNKYYQLFYNLDYYLYMGMDEGQMGVLDAHAAGIKTIVTKQGYHLDLNNSVTHFFTTYQELLNIFLEIQKKKEILIHSVSDLTWRDYAIKHIECWKYVLTGEKIESNYSDGINSLELKKIDNRKYKLSKRKLILNKYLHYFFILKRRFFN